MIATSPLPGDGPLSAATGHSAEARGHQALVTPCVWAMAGSPDLGLAAVGERQWLPLRPTLPFGALLDSCSIGRVAARRALGGPRPPVLADGLGTCRGLAGRGGWLQTCVVGQPRGDR